jgi:hypothetical protein
MNDVQTLPGTDIVTTNYLYQRSALEESHKLLNLKTRMGSGEVICSVTASAYSLEEKLVQLNVKVQ